MGLAENDVRQRPGVLWARRAGMAALVIAMVAGLVYLVKGLAGDARKPARQVARITILPDTPPPPPPPPKEPPKEQPKEQPKEVNIQQPKPVEAPPQQAEQLKMEGAAGDGPSAFGAGAVREDYKGQTLGQGGGVSGLGRAEFSLYLARLQRLLQEELARKGELKRVDYRVPASVRLGANGRVESVHIDGSTGQTEIDELLRSELLRLLQSEPPPSGAPRGFVVRVTNRTIN